jgi:hypothetical protein
MEKVLIFVTATALAAAAWASPPKYKFVEAWGKQGSGNGEFVNPMDVSLASNGNFYVADMGNNRVQYFTSTGSFLGKWPVGGLYPNGIYVASNGNVYVTLYQSHCVMYYPRPVFQKEGLGGRPRVAGPREDVVPVGAYSCTPLLRRGPARALFYCRLSALRVA